MFGMGNRRPGPAPAADKPPPKAAKRPALVTVTVRLTAEQRDKLQRLGGDEWVREQIESAEG